jgi:three-Cys-motif partner protein
MACPTHLSFMPKVDLSNYEGREQAYVKHFLLENYLSKWSYIIGSSWDSLVFIDGFAGPWGAKDEKFADASFSIAVRALNEAIAGLLKSRKRVVRGLCVFVEKKPDAFKKLDAFAKARSTDQVGAVALKGRFIQNIPVIDNHVAEVGVNPFKFVFLDQKGWAATPMKNLKPFLQTRSCEVMFNLMTSFLTRFIEREDLAPSFLALYGREGVLEKIRALPKGTGQREDAAVSEYCQSLRDVCGFKYVSQAVILDPNKEKVRYYLIFATNSLRGIEVFKKAEKEAAETQDEVRHERRIRKTSQPSLPYEGGPPKSPKILHLRQQYITRARKRLIKVLSRRPNIVVPYEDLYGEAMAFAFVTPDDLVTWLAEFVPHIRIHLAGQNRKKPLPWKNDYVVVVNSKALLDRF